jgi:hypothetical protein
LRAVAARCATRRPDACRPARRAVRRAGRSERAASPSSGMARCGVRTEERPRSHGASNQSTFSHDPDRSLSFCTAATSVIAAAFRVAFITGGSAARSAIRRPTSPIPSRGYRCRSTARRHPTVGRAGSPAWGTTRARPAPLSQVTSSARGMGWRQERSRSRGRADDAGTSSCIATAIRIAELRRPGMLSCYAGTKRRLQSAVAPGRARRALTVPS